MLKKFDAGKSSPAGCSSSYQCAGRRVRKGEGVKEIVSLEPDLVDDYGHHLRFNQRLKEACDHAEIDFSALANKHCDTRIIDQNHYIYPTFTRNSWDSEGLSRFLRRRRVASFEAELRSYIQLRLNDNNINSAYHKNIIIFMYCASLDHAHAMYNICEEFEQISAVAHLFRIHFSGIGDSKFVKRWASMVARIRAHPRLRLVLPSEQSARRFESVFDVSAEVALHPSMAFSDETAIRLMCVADRVSGPTTRPLRIVFPGGVRPEKGFGLSVNAARRLSERSDVVCVVRAIKIRRDGLSEVMERLLSELEQSLCVIQDKPLPPAEFQEFLSSADILVVPYLPPEFSERTSGLLIDGMVLGVPIVVGRGTWLGDFVEREGCGLSVDLGSADSLIEGIEKVIAELPRFRRQTREARARYLKKHSWERFVESLVTETGGEGFASRDLTPSGIERLPDVRAEHKRVRDRIDRENDEGR